MPEFKTTATDTLGQDSQSGLIERVSQSVIVRHMACKFNEGTQISNKCRYIDGHWNCIQEVGESLLID